MTAPDNDTLQAMLDAATPGPWQWWTSNSWKRLTGRDNNGHMGQEGGVLCPTKSWSDGHPDCIVSDADAALIAAAPALARELIEARKALAKIEADRMHNRVQYDPDGSLDEVVTNGGAHLEQMDKKSWFLAMYRADGSSFCAWIRGKVTLTEERDPPRKATP